MGSHASPPQVDDPSRSGHDGHCAYTNTMKRVFKLRKGAGTSLNVVHGLLSHCMLARQELAGLDKVCAFGVPSPLEIVARQLTLFLKL